MTLLTSSADRSKQGVHAFLIGVGKYPHLKEGRSKNKFPHAGDIGHPRAVDLMKLPHHGSAGNVTVVLLKAFPVQAYVVSSDGNSRGHPGDLAIARIVDTAPGSKVSFNYPGPAYKRWLEFSADDPARVDVSSTLTKILTIDVPLTD